MMGGGCGVPQNGTPRDTVHLHRQPPPASTGYRRPPLASTGSCSSSLHHALLHRLLFNHPSPRAPIQPLLHGLLFIHPSIVYCSSSPPHHGVLFNHPSTGTPPPSTVHPALHRLLFIQSSTPRGPIQPPLHGQPSTVYCSSSPPPHHRALFIQRQRHRSLFIQTPRNTHCSSRGSIDRLQLAAVAKESLDRVQ